MKQPTIKPTVQLIGQDGNAFFIMAKVIEALRKAGADKEYTDKYIEESILGDYENLLITAMEYVNVE